MAMDQQKVLARIRKLLERANHPKTPDEEAEACMAAADGLMLKYAIEQATIDALRPASDRVKPETARITICFAGNPLWRQLVDLAGRIAHHCRCRDIYYGLRSEGRHGIDIGLVGYKSDIEYFEMLFTSLMLQLTSRLEPKPDPSKSLAENVYLMHEAGVKWRRMADLLNAETLMRPTSGAKPIRRQDTAHWWEEVRPNKDQPDLLIPWPDGHRLINLYRKYCKKIGEEPHAITSPVNYQRNFAEGFYFRIASRLWEMEQRNEKEAGTALVLRRDSVNELYDELYGDLKESKRKRKELRHEAAAQSAGRLAADQADLGGNRMGSATKRQLT